MRESLTKFFWNIEVLAVQKHVNLVDLVKSFPKSYSNEYLLAKIGVDTAENEPLKVHLIFKLWDLIFADPPRPASPGFSLRVWYMNNDPRNFEGPWGK